MKQGQTIYDKIWASHVVYEDARPLLYIDRHFIHEVTSPQAFESLRIAGRKVRRPDLCIATMDHNVSTLSRDPHAAEETSRLQMEALKQNCKEFGISLFDIHSPNNGIVHVIGPELALTLPGMTIVCGDSHTSTHGAFGALAFGIGTSEVEHVLAAQSLPQDKAQNMLIYAKDRLQKGLTAKDLILAIIGVIGANGGQGYVIEYAGEAISALSMEGRMTLCNMSIEGGAKAGLIAPDEKTYDYLRRRDFAPKEGQWDEAQKKWEQLHSDADASYDKKVEMDASLLAPQVTWGTNPAQVSPVDGRIPLRKEMQSDAEREVFDRALAYMDLQPGMPMEDIQIDRVFIGSCTNGRIEDLRAAASVVRGKRLASRVKAMVVPGSVRVRKQAEEEGLDRIFEEAGLEWRLPGCSMCLAMNNDVLAPKERCASTSNRNFEGRQGRGGRTHLLSPAMAAAAAVAGHFVDVRGELK